jgi:hypothetical protein
MRRLLFPWPMQAMTGLGGHPVHKAQSRVINVLELAHRDLGCSLLRESHE